MYTVLPVVVLKKGKKKKKMMLLVFWCQLCSHQNLKCPFHQDCVPFRQQSASLNPYCGHKNIAFRHSLSTLPPHTVLSSYTNLISLGLCVFRSTNSLSPGGLLWWCISVGWHGISQISEEGVHIKARSPCKVVRNRCCLCMSKRWTAR